MNDVLMKADLQDLASPKLEKLKKNVGEVEKGSNILKGAFGDLTSKAEEMGVPLGKMESYFGKLNPAMLGGVAAAGAVAVGLGALAMNAIKVGADLQDMSDTTGLSVESLSSMRNVLAASNMDTKGYADGISKLSIKLGENGAAFKKLGIDVNDPEKAFDQIKHKIGDMTNPLEKAQFANKAFGKSFKDLMPLLTMANDEYDEMKGNTHVFSSEFAANAAKVDDNISLLKTAFSDFGVQLGANFIPLMSYLVDLLTEAADYWGSKAKGDPHELQTKGMQVKTPIGGRIGTANLSDKNINTQDAQNQLKAMNSQQLLDLAVWANIEQDNKVLANTLVKMSKEKKKLEEEIKKKEAEERANKFKATGLMDSFGSDDKKKKSDLTPEEQARQTDNFRLNSLEINSTSNQRNKFEDDWNKAKEALDKENQSWAEDRYKEENKALGDAYKERIEMAKDLAGTQLSIFNSLSQSLTGSLITPLDSFYKRVGSGNKRLFASFGDLFDDIGDSFGNMLAGMLAELTQKAIIFGLLNAFSGGGFGFAKAGLESFKWFAGGTDYNYGGIAKVGERGPETVYLPKGSKVVPSDKANREGDTYNLTVNGNNLSIKEVTYAVSDSFKTLQKRNEYRRAR